MKRTILFFICFILLCAYFILRSTSTISPPTATSLKEEVPIKFGIMLCLTGDCAEWGTNSLKGAELAAEQINARGGILGRKLELIIHDSHDTTPSNTVTALRELLIDKDIKYIIGPTWTAGGMPIAPIIAKRKDLIVTSPSVGVKDFNETASNILNIWPHDEIATRKLAQYAISKGWKKAAIFGSEDPWVKTQSNTFQEEFTKLGGSITAREEPLFALYEDPAKDFKESFQNKFQNDPGITADTSYDIVMLYAQAIQDTGSTDTTKTLQYLLSSVKNFRGASGSFSINQEGAVDKKPVLWIVKGLDYRRL